MNLIINYFLNYPSNSHSHQHRRVNSDDSASYTLSSSHRKSDFKRNEIKRKVYRDRDTDPFKNVVKVRLSHKDSSQESDKEMKEINAEKIDEADHQMKETNEKSENDLSKTRLVRCTYWPMCEKGEECAYLHPNKPCIMFPNCQYGHLCRYIHPVCRYDGFCTRLDCIYVHLNKKAPVVTVNTSEVTTNAHVTATNSPTESSPSNSENGETVNKPAVGAGVNASIFYGQGKYAFPMNSQYNLVNNRTNIALLGNQIPINCKYDTLCKNPNCAYLHSTNNTATSMSLPPKSQLKWKATPQTQTNFVSTPTELAESNSVVLQTQESHTMMVSA